jgi:hypothetical protein
MMKYNEELARAGVPVALRLDQWLERFEAPD